MVPDDQGGTTAIPATLADAALDTMPGQVAILDGEGTIVRTNDAWRQFGAGNDLQSDTVGVDYLVAADHDDEHAQRAVAGLREVLDGRRDQFELEYPCHSPNERRWFLLRAVPFEHDGDQFVTVSHLNITDRRLAEERVEQANAELTEQRELLALLNQVLRHDVGNDVNVVSGLAAQLADELDGEAAEIAERIRTSAEHVADLTQAAGELTDLVAGGEGELQSVDAGRVLREEVDKLRRTHRGRGEPVTVREGPIADGVTVAADDLLSSVFGNLLTNAVLHNHNAEPTVEASLTVADGVATVRIADDGPGIPEDRRDEVFGRGEKGLESPGSGLGLYLVDRLVDRYGGDVSIEDADLGGAAFVVELPLADDG